MNEFAIFLHTSIDIISINKRFILVIPSNYLELQIGNFDSNLLQKNIFNINVSDDNQLYHIHGPVNFWAKQIKFFSG